MILKINFRPLSWIILTFIAFTIIGTLSHELGHLVVARYLGYETTLHHSSFQYYGGMQDTALLLYEKKSHAIANGLEFDAAQSAEFDRAFKKAARENTLITIGGPLQTILTGSIAFLILLYKRKRIAAKGLDPSDWLLVFLSLFWLREITNLVMSVSSELIYPEGSFFGGDEVRISSALGLPEGTISVIAGTIGLLLSIYIVFKIIPLKLRSTFILGGFIGGVSGYLVWMEWIGPVVLP